MLDPGDRVDRYVVESTLGRGGMAVVYKVRHAELGTFHALKVLNALDPAVRDRLAREGRVQGMLRHPNVVAVSDLVDVRGQSGLVMEYVDGPSLDGLLETHRLTVPQADALLQGVMAGVLHAHRHGFVHRDLKPANLLLAPSEAGLIPKVADFGLAKLILGDGPALGATRTGVMMGTPAYMAPEQIRDSKSVDQRADVFSLGVVMYEVVVGRRPFEGDDLMQVLQAVCAGRYVPPAELVPALPARVVDAIEGALMVNRDLRIQDVATLLDTWNGVKRGRAANRGATSVASDELIPLPDWIPAARATRGERRVGAVPSAADLRIASTADPVTSAGPSLAAIDPSNSGDHVGADARFVSRAPWGAVLVAAVAVVGGAWGYARWNSPTVSVEPPLVVASPPRDPPTPRPGPPASRPPPEGRPATEPVTTPARVARPFDDVGLAGRDAVQVEDLRHAGDATQATILVEGVTARLRRGDDLASPGEPISPGRWAVEVSWDEHSWQRIGDVDVMAGELVTVRCTAVGTRCDGPLDMAPRPG
jgi:serine/threonine protein kinase